MKFVNMIAFFVGKVNGEMLCHTFRQIAFRRVADGALPARGRMEGINHGRTRTELTNVRVLLDKGERK